MMMVTHSKNEDASEESVYDDENTTAEHHE